VSGAHGCHAIVRCAACLDGHESVQQRCARDKTFGRVTRSQRKRTRSLAPFEANAGRRARAAAGALRAAALVVAAAAAGREAEGRGGQG
jgi:hypothetical protein